MERNESSSSFWILLAIFGFAILVSSTSASAKGYIIKSGETKGSSITSVFHYKNCDGEAGSFFCEGGQGGDSPGLLTTFQGKDSLGDVNGQIIGDYDSGGGGDCSSSSATFNTPIRVKIAQGVLNYEKGQLFIERRPGDGQNSGCMEFWETIDGTEIPSYQPAFYFMKIDYLIVGGTGEYEGAEGSLTSETKGYLLYNDVSRPANQFGSVESAYEGSFTTP